MVRKLKLSDEIIQRISNCSDGESDAKMLTTREMLIVWGECKLGYAAELAIQEGWDEPDLDKTRTWYIESVCANVSTIAHSSGYNRMRVGENVCARGYDVEHGVISFSVWLFLLRNLKKGKDGLVPKDKLQERIDWYYEEFDEFGKPPSTRDIEKHVKKNGEHPAWWLDYRTMINKAKNIPLVALRNQEDVPEIVNKLVMYILDIHDNNYKIYRGEQNDSSVTAGLEAEVSND